MTLWLRRVHLLSTAFGLMMAAAAGIQTDGPALVCALLSVIAVLAGMAFRPSASGAVLLATAALVLSDGPPMVAALTGLSAACYLVLRHTEAGPVSVIGASTPAMLSALGFTFVGVLAASFPFEVPWLPLLAPVAVFAIYVLATRPFFTASAGGPEVNSRS